MSIIKTTEEIVRERMSECADACANQFIDSIRPIYGSTKTGNPIHIATCVFLRIESSNYLLTAAHVIDHKENTLLYVGGESELILIEENFTGTTKPNNDRDNDHYDFAWLLLNDELIHKIGNISFIEINSATRPYVNSEGNLHLALGYPNSKNKKYYNRENPIKPLLFPYSSTVKHNDALCKELGITGNNHLCLDYDSKYSKDDEGRIVNSISPKGLSGGALIDMGTLAQPDSYKPNAPCKCQIAGMLVENHKKYKSILAVKIGFIVQKIKNNNAL